MQKELNKFFGKLMEATGDSFEDLIEMSVSELTEYYKEHVTLSEERAKLELETEKLKIKEEVKELHGEVSDFIDEHNELYNGVKAELDEAMRKNRKLEYVINALQTTISELCNYYSGYTYNVKNTDNPEIAITDKKDRVLATICGDEIIYDDKVNVYIDGKRVKSKYN